MGLHESSVKQYSRICSRHFRNGDPANGPDKSLGRKFASPKKQWSRRALRAQQRNAVRSRVDRLSISPARLSQSSSRSPTPVPTPCLTPTSPSSRCSTPTLPSTPILSSCSSYQSTPLSDDSSFLSESLESDTQDQAREISESISTDSLSQSLTRPEGRNSEVVVNTALLVRIEMLESENQLLKKWFGIKKKVIQDWWYIWGWQSYPAVYRVCFISCT